SAGSPSATSRPLCSTTMRSARLLTTSILCSTSRIVLSPSPLSFLMRSRMTGTSSTDMPAVGSSNMKTCGSSAIMMATSSLRLSPRRSELRRLDAVDQHGAGAGGQLSRDQVEVGGLARTVGADDGRQRARMESGAHAVDGDVAAEADGEIARFQDRLGHAARPRSNRCHAGVYPR